MMDGEMLSQSFEILVTEGVESMQRETSREGWVFLVGGSLRQQSMT